jgi:pentatricopeptide repeat protein
MYLHLFPSIVDFTQLLGMVVKVKYYSEVITLIEKLESLRPKIYPNVYNMSVLINCFCHLNWVEYGFLVLARMVKLGYQPSQATINMLLNELCIQGQLQEAVLSKQKKTSVSYDIQKSHSEEWLSTYCNYFWDINKWLL